MVHASNCGPSLLSLLHGNMIQSTIAALKGLQSLIKKSATLSSHTPHNDFNFNRNDTINNRKSEHNNIGSIHSRNNANSSPLIQLLTSSSFSTNDAHSLPTEIREVSLNIIFITNLFLKLLFETNLNEDRRKGVRQVGRK